MLLDVAMRTTLHQLVVDEAFVNNIGGVRMLSVSVDARTNNLSSPQAHPSALARSLERWC